MKMNFNQPPQNKLDPENKKRDETIIKKTKQILLGLVATGLSMSAQAKNENTDRHPLPDSNKIAKTIDNKNDNKGELNKTSEKIEIANYFETDKAEISPENVQEISKLVSTYITHLNSHNINQFLNSAPKLNVSCDPRNTNSYENGNVGLAEARAEKAQQIIKNIVTNFNFSHSDLTPEQTKKAIEKFSNLHFNIPTGGVIDYHTIINKKTNALFTDAEWAQLQTPGNEEEMLKVYKEMRYVNAEFAILDSEKPKGNLEAGGSIFEIGDYKKVIFAVDKSPSMEAHKKMLIDSITSSTNIDIKTKVVGWTNKIDTVFDADNLKDAAEIIEEMQFVNEEDEYAVDAAVQTLQGIEKDGKEGVMFIVTDEELQNVSQEKLDRLDSLSKDKKIKLMFTVMIGEDVYKLDLEDIQKAFNEKYEQSGKREEIESASHQLAVFKKILKEQTDELAATTNKDDMKHLRKDIADTKIGVAGFEHKLKILHEINISNFKDIVKKGNVTHIGPDFTKRSDTVSL